MIPTPHNECSDKNLIAKTVLMPGDPLRAKYIADTYLSDVICFNSVRNNLGYTGYYKGNRISVMSSGMGIPSFSIYAHELYTEYDVDRIVRIGSAGAYSENLDVYDVCLVKDAFSQSSFAKVFNNDDSNILESTQELNQKIMMIAEGLNIPLHVIRAHSSDCFYSLIPNTWKKIRDDYICDVVEMESFGLFSIAKGLKKEAACLLTISDSFVTNKVISSLERQKSFNKMIEIALNLAK